MGYSPWVHKESETTEQLSVYIYIYLHLGFPGGSVVKNPPAKQETQVRSNGLERPSEERNGNSKYQLQYSCLENPMDGGGWQATVHRVAES